jgi:hypothetical protein
MPDPNKKLPPPVHNRAAQVAAGGYAKNQLVIHSGVTWKSLIANNLSIPGEHPSWDYYGIPAERARFSEPAYCPCPAPGAKALLTQRLKRPKIAGTYSGGTRWGSRQESAPLMRLTAAQ